MPFFNNLDDAQRYSQSRPYFHPIAIERANMVFGFQIPCSLAVDVACGTGQSSTALFTIAEKVIGFDISRNMLAAGERNQRSLLVQSKAEYLPLPSNMVPLVSCALAFHWLDRERFLHEAWRVLNDGGFLLIYNNGFRGFMRENPAFARWGPEVYLKRFPTPPRDSRPITKEEAREAGFVFVAEESYENEVIFTPEQLVAYLMTQTNVSEAMLNDRMSKESVYDWLVNQTSPFFVGHQGTFVFKTVAWYLIKQSRSLTSAAVDVAAPQ